MTDAFSRFWTAYPRKEAKAYALECWNRLKPAPDIEKVVAWVESAKTCEQWQTRKWIPMPSTFINQRRWDGELPPGCDEAVTIESTHQHHCNSWHGWEGKYGDHYVDCTQPCRPVRGEYSGIYCKRATKEMKAYISKSFPRAVK